MRSSTIDQLSSNLFLHQQENQQERIRLAFSWRWIARTIFWIVFYLCFWLSGVLTMASMVLLPFDYRMGLASLLVLPLFLHFRIKLNAVTVGYVVLVLIALISGVINDSPLRNIALFLRIPFFSFLIYHLVEICAAPTFMLRVLRLCVPLSLVQLPVLLLQRAFYSYLPAEVSASVHPIDFDFGTFNFKGDSKMAFFLVMMTIFLLFNRQRFMVTRWPGLLAIWATATVMLANSEIAKVAAAMVWGFFFLTKLNRKFAWRLLIGVVIALSLFIMTEQATTIVDKVVVNLQRVARDLNGNPAAVERYLNGGYSRGGAIYFYLNNDLLWFGDGPARYTNPINRERMRGDVGHIFSFYSEIGLLGLLTSLLILALIVFHVRGWRVRKGFQPLLMYGVALIFIFTLQFMNDISVVLAYCIFAKSHLLAHIVPSQAQIDAQPAR